LDLLQYLSNAVGAALPSALLLWLAASLHARTCSGHTLSQRSMALGLAAVGIWWPLQLAGTVADGAGATGPVWQATLVALSLALPVLAARAGSSTHRWLSSRRAGAAAAALLLSLLTIATVSGAPGSASAVSRTSLGAAALAGALLALALPLGDERVAARLRAAAALAAAAALVFAPAALHDAQGVWAHAALWPTLALALMGGGVLSVLRQRQPLARTSARQAGPPIEPLEDTLTRLPTRAHFETQLAAAVVRCDASDCKLALLFIDLDGFKPVNDSFGHSSGDRVLHGVGKRLKACADNGDVVARVGGDEFLLLITNAGTPENVAQRARKIVDSLAQPFELEDRQVSIGCSIGIAFYPDNGQHAKLVARADAAMYAAKRAGGGGFCFFAAAMEDDARERFDLLRDLRVALERNELELYYQPKIDAASGGVTAAEALLRWHHPTRGMVPPGVFIPIAERFGLIRSLGEWVIEDACRQASSWHAKGLRIRVAVNLSALQVRQDDIVARIEGALARHRIDPSMLTCEVSESVAMEDTKATQTTLRELGAAGVHLSIDDFGTGYSSLGYLSKLPVEELKIDRSFVTDVEHSADARAVVDAVVKLAHALGLKVVAEGIENERQQEILTRLGCDELQGFLFAKPMTARALLLWATDPRKGQARSLSTSLFGSTQAGQLDFQSSTRVSNRGFADTAKQPVTTRGH